MKPKRIALWVVVGLLIMAVIGLLVVFLLPAIVETTLRPSSSALQAKCQARLSHMDDVVQPYKSNKKGPPPIRGGNSDALSWAMYLKDNNKGAGKLNNSLFFCPVLDRTAAFNDADFATDDGDYMFNVGTDEVNPLSEDAPPDTILVADCVTPDGSMSNHEDPEKNGVNVLLKNGTVHTVSKGDDLFERLQKANMVSGADSGNPHCPSPGEGEDETPESSDAK